MAEIDKLSTSTRTAIEYAGLVSMELSGFITAVRPRGKGQARMTNEERSVMTESNSTLSAPPALPISPHPLVTFDRLRIQRCKVLDSIFIAPPPDWSAYGPGGDVFNPPVQVVVLDLKSDEVAFGIYAHPDLRCEQGPEPDEQWREQWQEACHSAPEADAQQIAWLAFADELYHLVTLHHFCYTALQELICTEDMDYPPETRMGLQLFLRWLRDKDQALCRQFERLRTGAATTTANDGQAD